ncbi:response regulator [Cellulophaga sp. Hel_I_12]|uniref:response regulator n=1 Tax=Cellulophaga sp. Hel_I_12 TaxID=1249972 RepID=UPI000648917C|nr:response regulator [Cellulophaga sp. Hel_I_12]
MKKKINVLIAEDHHLIIEAYKKVLEEISIESLTHQFVIETANDCESARAVINSICESKKIHLALLDISLPPTKDKKILSGTDLGILLKNRNNGVKIIILTSHNDSFRLNNILKEVDPNGFLVKTDIKMENLKLAILGVLAGKSFYSETVLNMLRTQIRAEIVLDKIDRQLLYELSRGVKMKDLPGLLPLSMGGIESRKRKLKEVFKISKEKDAVLLEVARQKGFI